MADAAVLGDLGPLAAPSVQSGADFGVEVVSHALTLAILCYGDKQHIAPSVLDHREMKQNFATSPLAERLASNLKDVMAERGVGQTILAERSGIGQTTISLYLNPGRRLSGKSGRAPSPTLAVVEKLAAALGVEPVALLSLGGTLATATQKQPEFSDGELALIGAVRKLPGDEQNDLLRDVLARAERVDEIVRQALRQRGIPAQTGAIQASLIGYVDRGFRNGKSDNDRRVAKQGDRRGHPGTTGEGGGG